MTLRTKEERSAVTEPHDQPDRFTGALPRRPETVWPCPPPDPDIADDGPLARWLLAAVERLVTTYTRPGDPVLLLSPAGREGTAAQGQAGAAEPLSEAVGTVDRLARTVRVRTAPATRRSPAGSQSGPGPGLQADCVDGRPGSDQTQTGAPDRFALALVAVTPSAAGDVDMAALAALLTPTGTLAVLTHSDSRGGWLIDPTGELSEAAGLGGLALVDRIVVLEIPLDGLARPDQPLSTQMVAHRAHSDLLLFTTIARARSTSAEERR